MVFTIFFMEDEDRNAIVLRREEEMHCLYKAFASFLDVFKLVNIPTSARPEPSSDLQGNALSTTSDKPTWKSTLDKSDLGIKGVLHNYSQPSDRFSSWSNKTSSQVGSWAPTAFSNRNTNTSVESSSTRGYRLRYGNAQHGSVLRADPSPVRSRTYFPKGRFGEESALSWNSDSILQRSAIPRDAGASFHASHGNSFSDYQWRRPSRLADRWTPTTTRSAGPTGFDGLWSSRAEGRSPLLERSLDAKPDNEAQERVENPPYTVTPVERRSPRRTPRKEPTAAPRQGDFGGIVVSSKLLVKSVSRRVPELQVGDKVVCIDGKRVTSLDDLRERMNTDLPRETLVTVKRGDVRKVIKLTPTAAHGEARWVY
ncbi:hypothetical protein AGDE_17181 [Angomonas deanei]|nr:hypothetical protein AGDE_17181 [Angomonas deanei]|eukprot:EPY15091.1 hypothetical protein AGDE_17181 [Angomonas deanei]